MKRYGDKLFVPSQCGEWDVVDVFDLAPPRRPTRIDFFDEPWHGGKPNRRGRRVIVLTNEWLPGARLRHAEKAAYAVRGRNDRYARRRELARVARSYAAARRLKYAPAHTLTSGTGGIV